MHSNPTLLLQRYEGGFVPLVGHAHLVKSLKREREWREGTRDIRKEEEVAMLLNLKVTSAL